jgi:hypothetical protein
MCREVAENEPSERECIAIAGLGKLVARRALPDVNEIMIGRIMLLDIVVVWLCSSSFIIYRFPTQQ